MKSDTRALDSYSRILRAFESVFELPGWTNDKTGDQFADLLSAGLSSINKPAISMRSSQGGNTSRGGSGSTQSVTGHDKRKQAEEAGGVPVKQRTTMDGGSVARRTHEDDD